MRNSSDTDVSILCLEEETEYKEVENIMDFVFGAEIDSMNEEESDYDY